MSVVPTRGRLRFICGVRLGFARQCLGRLIEKRIGNLGVGRDLGRRKSEKFVSGAHGRHGRAGVIEFDERLRLTKVRQLFSLERSLFICRATCVRRLICSLHYLSVEECK